MTGTGDEAAVTHRPVGSALLGSHLSFCSSVTGAGGWQGALAGSEKAHSKRSRLRQSCVLCIIGTDIGAGAQAHVPSSAAFPDCY